MLNVAERAFVVKLDVLESECRLNITVNLFASDLELEGPVAVENRRSISGRHEADVEDVATTDQMNRAKHEPD